MSTPTPPRQLAVNATKAFDRHLVEDHVQAVRQLSLYREAWHDAMDQVDALTQLVADLREQMAEAGLTPITAGVPSPVVPNGMGGAHAR